MSTSLASAILAIFSSVYYLQDTKSQITLLYVQSFFMGINFPSLIVRFSLKPWRVLLASPYEIADVVGLSFFLMAIFYKYEYHVMVVVRLVNFFYIFDIIPPSRIRDHYNISVHTLRKCFMILLIIFAFIGVNAFFFSYLIWYAERGHWENGWWIYPDGTISPFQNVFVTLWWANATMSTVGYGDFMPRTITGKAIAALTGSLGSIVIAFPSAIVGSIFGQYYTLVPSGYMLEVVPQQNPHAIQDSKPSDFIECADEPNPSPPTHTRGDVFVALDVTDAPFEHDQDTKVVNRLRSITESSDCEEVVEDSVGIKTPGQ